MRALQAAERFVKQVESDPGTDRAAEAERLLKALAATRWEDATPKEKEQGWMLTLRLALLKQAPGESKDSRAT
jgi:hypothetical protein